MGTWKIITCEEFRLQLTPELIVAMKTANLHPYQDPVARDDHYDCNHLLEPLGQMISSGSPRPTRSLIYTGDACEFAALA
jgi:hypothetical protein